MSKTHSTLQEQEQIQIPSKFKKVYSKEDQEIILEIAQSFTKPWDCYSDRRASLILLLGYHKFRDLQCAAFETLFGGQSPIFKDWARKKLPSSTSA